MILVEKVKSSGERLTTTDQRGVSRIITLPEQATDAAFRAASCQF